MSKISVWSKAVRLRDGKCQHCGSIHDLQAHHIKPKLTNPELVYDVTNGITLCYRCHKAEHERTRHPRIRSANPHKSTVIKTYTRMQKDIKLLTDENRRLSAKVIMLTNELAFIKGTRLHK